jgi:hypothetical protein
MSFDEKTQMMADSGNWSFSLSKKKLVCDNAPLPI